jgi:hypothetical protein
MNTTPGGDAMTVTYADPAALKREKVHPPLAWYIHPDDVARFAADHWHCETRECRRPITAASWRWWRSAEAGRVLLTEHLVCGSHAREFADRHGITIDPPPDRPSRPPNPGMARRQT